jgi:hypothetical protein
MSTFPTERDTMYIQRDKQEHLLQRSYVLRGYWSIMRDYLLVLCLSKFIYFIICETYVFLILFCLLLITLFWHFGDTLH